MASVDALGPVVEGPMRLQDVPAEARGDVIGRGLAIAVIAFLTLIDLFGSQALLPALVEAYDVSPAAMGFAVNASTIGMAIAGVAVAAFAHRIDRVRGIAVALAVLSVPTFLLGVTEDLTTFTLLRIAQGLCMAAAFTLTLTLLSEVCSVTAASGAMAAYITGNVASNLAGRMMASGIADEFGLPVSFFSFALLNLAGAVFAYVYFSRWTRVVPMAPEGSLLAAWGDHLRNRRLRAAFGIGFLILLVFVGVFTYVNFVLAEPPVSLPQTRIGLVYLVFIPSILTTPLAGNAVRRFGTLPVFRASIGVALLGLGLTAVSSLPAVILGLAAIGAGLFFAQAAATGFVGRVATHDHAAANGIYLSSYYVGGLLGALVLGQVFVAGGWGVTVALMALCLAAALALAQAMRETP